MIRHGGGIIKRQLNKALLFALAIVICTLPLSGAVDNLSTSQSTSTSQVTNIDSANSASVAKQEVNAASYYWKKKTYYVKKYKYKKKYQNGRYRYVRAAYYIKVTKYVKVYYKSSYSSSGSKGTGDCWTNSEILYNKLKAQGYRVRIIQYATSMSSRHRSVQYYKDGKWVNYDYKGNGYAMRYWYTSNYVNGKVIKSC
ncbi:MAG: hypothetical protein ABFC91_00105 [Methanobacteriaceae archaeon]